MAEAFIIDALRTPVGRRGGGLSAVHPADLAAAVIGETVRRTGIGSDEFDEVILGAIDQVGPQAMDIARTAWLAAGLSERVPGTTVERQCGSGQQADLLRRAGGDERNRGPGDRRRGAEHVLRTAVLRQHRRQGPGVR